MKLYEIGTGYTSIPAKMGAATEIVIEELTKIFMQENVDVSILDIQTEKRGANQLPILEVAVPFISSETDVKLGILHKMKRVLYSIELTKKLKRLLKQEEEEVVLHFHNQYNMFFFLLLTTRRMREKVHIAYTVHSYIWPGKWEDIKRIVKKRYFQEIYCVKKADYVLVLNDKTAEHFANYLKIDKKHIYKVGNGVNTEVYVPLPDKDVREWKKEKNLSGKRIIFQAGSVCDRKNQFGAVNMLKAYLKDHKDVVYIYAGGIIDSDYQRAIEKLAREYEIAEQVLYVGEVPPGEELNKYYNGADVTLFPSKIESFGLVLIESIAANTPVLLKEKPLFQLGKGYRVFGKEREDDEKASFLTEIDAILNQEVKMNIREEVVERYSWKAVGKEHLRIFNKMEK